MARSLGPGDRIESRCTRCNDVTGHVIVALVGGEIVKVECKACGSVHKYYPPVTPKLAKEKNTVCRVKPGEDRKVASTSSKSVSSAASAKARKAAEDIEQTWQRSMNLTVATSRPYSMTGAFAVGDIVAHPKFGNGVVQVLVPPDKMQILFRDGSKLLRCAS